jgi:uncharacterized protein YprB with RNaseH-like and TPR domain
VSERGGNESVGASELRERLRRLHAPHAGASARAASPPPPAPDFELDARAIAAPSAARVQRAELERALRERALRRSPARAAPLPRTAAASAAAFTTGIAASAASTEMSVAASAAPTGMGVAASAAPIGMGVAASAAPPADLREGHGEHGCFAARERFFAFEHRHGDYALGEIEAAEPRTLALLARDPRLTALEPRRALYLDIETSGLAGGAGSYAFLVALARVEAEGVRLWQGFLREPGEERALLAEVAQRIAQAGALVSFFGKSFDRHRLEDKMRLHRLAPPFAEALHLDLYWPCRRLYGPSLPDGRLATMERALCGLARAHDLPGSLAPAAWFDFLAGRAHRLEAVFRHNEDDVLSLLTLAAHLGRVHLGTRACGTALGGDAPTRTAGWQRLSSARPTRPRRAGA